MNKHTDKTQENQSESVANTIAQQQSGSNTISQFKDNRAKTITQRKLQETANNSPQIKQAAQLQVVANNYSSRQQQPIQRMEAYDSEKINIEEDPRHFSTSEMKKAIDECIANGTPVPLWLKQQISGFLRDELSERWNDMQRHGGGDAGHKYYFEHVRGYAEKIDALPTEEDPKKQVPLGDGPVAQL